MDATSGGGLDATMVVRRSPDFRLTLRLSVAPGTTVALLGPNGAGKSTAIAAIAGLVGLDEGRITLAGVVFDDPAARVFLPAEARRVGVVFQDYLLFPHLTVLDNVMFGLRSRGVAREEAAERALAWLRRFDLEGLARRRPGELSGGQAQRVALARALAPEPQLLLLDEPLAALDVTTRAELRHALAEHLRAFSGPRLLITHDPGEAFLLADDIHVLEHGVVTQHGTADDIRLRPRTRYAADLAGANLVTGVADAGAADTGTLVLHIADTEASGPVLLTMRPTSISVHAAQPGGSPRNVWQTTIERIEPVGGRFRMLVGPPLRLTVEITREAAAELGLRRGSTVWLAVKATDIGVEKGP